MQNKIKMDKIKIQINDYPCTFSFNIDNCLPKFKYGCKIRTKLVRMLLKYQYYAVHHTPDDFIVEDVIKIKDGEIWILGS